MVSALFPGHDHTRTGIPVRVTANPITIWGRSSRESFDLPQVRNDRGSTLSLADVAWALATAAAAAAASWSVSTSPYGSR